MYHIKQIFALGLIMVLGFSAIARENIGSGKVSNVLKAQATGCSPATAKIDLNINNVRATLLNGGDMWWDLSSGKYEVPKIDPPGSAPSVTSVFAGAIWLGGIDAGGQLKMAAMTYRQNGNDFFPGPLDATATVDAATCSAYDRHWVVYSSEIDTFKTKSFPLTASAVPNDILIWPGKGNPYAVGAGGTALTITQDLAPFYDANGDGLYDPTQGDYPVINPTAGKTYGDQMIFWVYNDKGNIHTETNGQAIGVQIGALAFAFKTSDEVNNMTFYRYNIINKATTPINKFYMGQWVDPDLGCYTDDYVGCDTLLGLGYVYNGESVDGPCTPNYGTSPPIFGTDYFEGPIDDNGKVLGMSTFTYYNNDFTPYGNPQSAINYYNYMVGFWKNGNPIAVSCVVGGTGAPTHYMYPGDPDSPLPFPQSWSECSCKAQDPFGDRRYLQSSGPFTLQPGAINHITVGAVWVRQAQQSGCAAQISLLKAADQKAQALFDNGFKLVDGPDAPNLVIRELQNEIIITLTNDSLTSNNFGEKYAEGDPIIKALAKVDTASHIDTAYRFQGYKLYQLKYPTVTAENLNDPTLASLVAEVDIKDSISRIINYVLDPTVGVPVPVLEVSGNNKGITHSFDVKNDAFATGVTTLIDHKNYYFAAVSYAHNYYHSNLTGQSQQTPYLQGRRNFKVYSAIPHNPTPSQDGFTLHSFFGDTVPVTRLDGAGNGGFNVDLDSASVASILASNTSFFAPIVYQGGHAPVNVRVVDPYVLKNRDFVLTFIPPIDTNKIFPDPLWGTPFISPNATYKLEVFNNGQLENTFISKNTIANLNDFVVGNSTLDDSSSYGIALSLGQVPNVGLDTLGSGLGAIEATISYKDSLVQWLTGVKDQGTFDFKNWIRSGQYAEPTGSQAGTCTLNNFWDDYCVRDNSCKPTQFEDPNNEFGKFLSGTWAPYALAANTINGDIAALSSTTCPTKPQSIYTFGPAFTVTYRYNSRSSYPPGNCHANYQAPDNTLRRLQSVDIVLTPDKSKWSHCLVLEMQEDSSIAEGHGLKGFYRQHASIDKDGNYSSDPTDLGRGWFPGYAINVETGERLNVMFGEDSYLGSNNGRDMIWNPTANEESVFRDVIFGGRHAIYVTDTRYDGCDSFHQIMQDSLAAGAFKVVSGANPANQQKRVTINQSVYQHIMWTSYPELKGNYNLLSLAEGLIPTETKIRLRVRKPFTQFVGDNSNNGYPKYSFSTKGQAPDVKQHTVAVSALDLIRAVPNPYYAYSAYETSQLDNEVKITNLPANSTVTIYSIDGTLIRRFVRTVTEITSDGASTDKVNLDNSLNWDLKNAKNIPVASGVYIIHINAPGIGEKVIKWFGVLRPQDLDSF